MQWVLLPHGMKACMSELTLLALQVEFNFLESEAQFGIEMDGLKVEPYEMGTGTATSDYYLVLGHAGRRVTGRLEYNAELFAHETARRMAAEWQVRSCLMPVEVHTHHVYLHLALTVWVMTCEYDLWPE